MKHLHHIIPKHMGGSDDPSNLIELSIEEHALAHKELYEQYGKIEDEIAYKALSGQISGEEARRLAVSSSLKGLSKSTEHKKKISQSQKSRYVKLGGHPNKGKSNPKCSDARKMLISNANRGNKNRLGHLHSEETKSMMSESAKNRPLYTCPVCGTQMQKAPLSRYHGINGENCSGRP